MDCSDEESVRKAIENDRQSVKKAKEGWQQASDKEASESTFRAFLSALARDIDVYKETSKGETLAAALCVQDREAA